MKDVIERIKQIKWPLLVLLIAVPLVILVISLAGQKQQAPGEGTATQQLPFAVEGTSPLDKATNVSAGEIQITIATNQDVVSENSISLDIFPKVPYYFRFTNSYPTRQLIAQVYGGLTPSTLYTATLKDNAGKPIYSWSFTTSSTPAESSSQYLKETERESIDKDFPLFDFVPFETNTYSIDYTDPLVLEVIVRSGTVEQARQAVESWIRTKGVDPATHTINYK